MNIIFTLHWKNKIFPLHIRGNIYPVTVKYHMKKLYQEIRDVWQWSLKKIERKYTCIVVWTCKKQ